MTDIAIQTPISMRYKNWRGETAIRTVLPVGTLERKATEHHPEPQWIMRAWDYDKQAYRDFALADCDFAAMQPTPQLPRLTDEQVAELRIAFVDHDDDRDEPLAAVLEWYIAARTAQEDSQ